MKRRKILALTLCTALIAGLLPACGQKKEAVTITLKTPPLTVYSGLDPDIVEAYDILLKAGEDFAAQYDEADVTVNVVKFTYEEEQRYIIDCFDTEDAVDVLLEGYFNMSSYIHTGKPVPLDELVSDELKADFFPEDYAQGMIDGKTYMLPYFGLHNTMTYNKDLFRQCGLEEYICEEGEIANWSLEDWNIILDTLAEKLPDMVYPMMMYANDNQGDTHIMTLLRSHGSSFFDETNHFNLNTPEGIAALKWIQDGVDKGWYPNMPENISISDCFALFSNGQLAICMTNNASFVSLDHDKYGLVNFPSTNDTGISTDFMSGFMVFDNGDASKLQVAKDFVEFFYSEPEYLEYGAVAIPPLKSVADKYSDEIYMLDAYSANRDTIVNFTGNNPNWQGNNDSVRTVFWPFIHNLLEKKITPEECAAGIDKACNAAIDRGWEESTIHE